MAEFEMHHPPGGAGQGHGGGSFPPSKKKGKVNPLLIYVIGGVVIVVFLLLKGRSNNSGSTDTPVSVSDGNYPSNSVDTQAQLQNTSDMLTSNMNATLEQYSAGLQGQFDQLKTDIGQTDQGLIDKATASYQSQLDALSKQNKSLQGSIDKLNSHPTPTTPVPTKPVVTPKTPVPTKPVVTPSKPTVTPVKTTPKPPTVSAKQTLINKVDSSYKGTSIVDYLKGAKVSSSLTDRKKIAGTLGIKNYTGTASQNTAMLKALKSDGK